MADAAPALPPAARAPGPGVLVAGLLAWAFCSFCLMRIAAATGAGGGWMAWIPILNLVLMLRIAGRPLWWIVLFFVPGVNIVVLVLVWMSVTTACGKSQWLGALAALIPPFGVLVLAYLAFTKPGDVRGDLLMTMPVSSVEGHALPEAITDKAPMPRDHAVVLVQFVALGAKETGHTGASDIAGALTQVIKLYRQGALIIVREGGEYKLFLRRGVRI